LAHKELEFSIPGGVQDGSPRVRRPMNIQGKNMTFMQYYDIYNKQFIMLKWFAESFRNWKQKMADSRILNRNRRCKDGCSDRYGAPFTLASPFNDTAGFVMVALR
jgi:hypothetical protein